MVGERRKESRLRRAALRLAQPLAVAFAAVLAVTLAVPAGMAAQTVQTTETQPGEILGTVLDVNGNPVAGAKVVLEGRNPFEHKTVVTTESGFFVFDRVKPEAPHHIVIHAIGFAKWRSPTVRLAQGQVKLLGTIRLRLLTQHTVVHVTYNPVQIATQQVKLAEKQRILGIVPNFLISYNQNAAPLTPKLKFELALKVATAPTSFAGVLFMAGVRQAADSPAYQQGWEGYGQRVGAIEADSFGDIMFGAAVLPSLLHQDPRYFYQGTGGVWSRLRHAVFSPFVCRGDNGEMQPNYSSIGGDLASSALSNLYYPKSNRGPELVFSNFALGTAERVLARVAQEFILARFTHMGGNIKK